MVSFNLFFRVFLVWGLTLPLHAMRTTRVNQTISIEDVRGALNTFLNKAFHFDEGHLDNASIGNVSQTLDSATNFLLEKREVIQKRVEQEESLELATNGKTNEKCEGWCVTGVVIDSLFLALRMLDFNIVSCSPIMLVLWWTIGVLALHMDQGLTLEDSFFKLTQMITTVGYGTHFPLTDGMKVFHAMHGVVGLLMAKTPTYWIPDKLLARYHEHFLKDEDDVESHLTNGLVRFAPFAVMLLTSGLGYAADLHQAHPTDYATFGSAILDAFYLTIETATTIGYGDITPSTVAGKYFSIPWQIIVTDIFERSTLTKQTAKALMEERGGLPWTTRFGDVMTNPNNMLGTCKPFLDSLKEQFHLAKENWGKTGQAVQEVVEDVEDAAQNMVEDAEKTFAE